MYKRTTKGKALIGYGQESTAGMPTGWRSPVGRDGGWRRSYTVSYSSSRIIWVSTVEYHGLPERKKSPKVFS